MKKRILTIAVAATLPLLIAGCGSGRKIDSVSKDDEESKCAMEVVDDGGPYYYEIYRDKRTGVEYLSTRHGITPMYNEDGSLFVEGEEAGE